MHIHKKLNSSLTADGDSRILGRETEKLPTQRKSELQMWLLIAFAVTLTSAVYGVRQYLRQPLHALNPEAQMSLLTETEFIGSVSPANAFKIASPVPAVVQQILVKEGDQVDVNQPLVMLENLDFDQTFDHVRQQRRLAQQQIQQLQQQMASFYQVATLNAQMADSENQLSTAQLESQQVPLPQRQDSIPRAQATYDLASAQFDRMKSLYEEGALSQADLERFQAELKVAEADLASAKQANFTAYGVLQEQQNQRAVRQDLVKSQQNQQLVEMQGQLAAAQLQYEQWTAQLVQLQQRWGSEPGEEDSAGRMVIRATESGVVTHLPVTMGEQIFAGTALIEIAQLDILDAIVPVDARLINALQLNQQAVVSLGAGGQAQSFTAKVFSIQPIPSDDLTHQVKVQFQNPNHYLLVKQPAKVHFDIK